MKTHTTRPKLPKASDDIEPLTEREREKVEAEFPGSTKPTRPGWGKAHEEALKRAKMAPCAVCLGTGWSPVGDSLVTCPSCVGTGRRTG